MHRSSNSSNRLRREPNGVEAGEGDITNKLRIPGDLAGRIIGKRGATVQRIEQDTGARVQVQSPEVEGAEAVVSATGSNEQVKRALEEVRSEVAKHSAAIADGLILGEADMVREGPNASEWNGKNMECEIAVSALKPAFKCLIGKNGENIEKIRRECEVKIKIQDHRDVKEFQHVYISGKPEKVSHATQMVKKDLEAYEPERDYSLNQSVNNRVDLKVIKAKAKVKILGLAVGYLIGKEGLTINKIRDETFVDNLDLDKNEDQDGFNYVRFSGYVDPVLRALRQIQNLMISWCQKRRVESADVAEQHRGTMAHTRPIATTPDTDLNPTTAQQFSSAQPPARPAARPVLAREYSLRDADGNLIRFIRDRGDVYRAVVCNAVQPVPAAQRSFERNNSPQRQRGNRRMNEVVERPMPPPAPDSQWSQPSCSWHTPSGRSNQFAT